MRQMRVVFGFVPEPDRGHHNDISSFIEFLNVDKMANQEVISGMEDS